MPLYTRSNYRVLTQVNKSRLPAHSTASPACCTASPVRFTVHSHSCLMHNHIFHLVWLTCSLYSLSCWLICPHLLTVPPHLLTNHNPFSLLYNLTFMIHALSAHCTVSPSHYQAPCATLQCTAYKPIPFTVQHLLLALQPFLLDTCRVILHGAGSAAQRMSARGCGRHSTAIRYSPLI